MYFLFPRLAKKHTKLTVLLATWQDFDVVDRNIKFLLRLYVRLPKKCDKIRILTGQIKSLFIGDNSEYFSLDL